MHLAALAAEAWTLAAKFAKFKGAILSLLTLPFARRSRKRLAQSRHRQLPCKEVPEHSARTTLQIEEHSALGEQS